MWIIPPRNACPVCGCREQRLSLFLVCKKCQEMLTPDELVRVKTRSTRRRYFNLYPQ